MYVPKVDRIADAMAENGVQARHVCWFPHARPPAQWLAARLKLAAGVKVCAACCMQYIERVSGENKEFKHIIYEVRET